MSSGWIGRFLYRSLHLRRRCVLAAVREQGYADLYARLAAVLDDEALRNQFTCVTPGELAHPYWSVKIRAQHAFQIDLVRTAIARLGLAGRPITVVDVGDSAGTHIRYLKALEPSVRSLSVNLDPRAVERIRANGLEAICCRAEELDKYNITADLLLSFQTVEHLLDPIGYFRMLATRGKCDHLVVTVPYRRTSRLGLHYLRTGHHESQPAENVHVFELAPEDWRLLVGFAGWAVAAEKVYYQYPRFGLGRLLRPGWASDDFEGFYGMFLRKDPRWSDLYRDWPE